MKLDDEFTFGKHAGESLEDVMEDDPHYIIWLYKNVKSVVIPPSVIIDCSFAIKHQEDLLFSGETEYADYEEMGLPGEWELLG